MSISRIIKPEVAIQENLDQVEAGFSFKPLGSLVGKRCALVLDITAWANYILLVYGRVEFDPERGYVLSIDNGKRPLVQSFDECTDETAWCQVLDDTESQVLGVPLC